LLPGHRLGWWTPPSYDTYLPFPLGDSQGQLRLNEPAELMFASAHPTWDTLDEPDRAFLGAMGYALAPVPLQSRVSLR